MERYDLLKGLVVTVVEEFDVLCGDTVGSGSGSMRDCAMTTAINLRSLADAVEALGNGATHFRGVRLDGPLVFPSVRDCGED